MSNEQRYKEALEEIVSCNVPGGADAVFDIAAEALKKPTGKDMKYIGTVHIRSNDAELIHDTFVDSGLLNESINDDIDKGKGYVEYIHVKEIKCL